MSNTCIWQFDTSLLTPNTKYWPLSDWQCLLTIPTNLIFEKLLHFNSSSSLVLICWQKQFHRFFCLLTIFFQFVFGKIHISFHCWGQKNCATLRLGHFLEHCSIKFFPLIMTPPHQLSYLRDLEPAPQKPFYEGMMMEYMKQLLNLCTDRVISKSDFYHSDGVFCTKYLSQSQLSYSGAWFSEGRSDSAQLIWPHEILQCVQN